MSFMVKGIKADGSHSNYGPFASASDARDVGDAAVESHEIVSYTIEDTNRGTIVASDQK